jgi:LytR cell envelope-related transcriptional attenuator
MLFMEPAASNPSAPRSSASSGWVLFVAIGLAGIVAGMIGGWFLRGDGGPATVLPAAVGAVATSTQTSGVTTTAPAPPIPAALPERKAIVLSVLNGTTIAGFAAKTSTRAAQLGYPTPTSGNAPTQTSGTVVYFRDGQRPAARRVARDLGFVTITPIADAAAVVAAAPATANVVVVLGPG